MVTVETMTSVADAIRLQQEEKAHPLKQGPLAGSGETSHDITSHVHSILCSQACSVVRCRADGEECRTTHDFDRLLILTPALGD